MWWGAARLIATVARSRNEKNTRVRYIAGPPAATRGPQPSQVIILVKLSASDAKGDRAPDMWSAIVVVSPRN